MFCLADTGITNDWINNINTDEKSSWYFTNV